MGFKEAIAGFHPGSDQDRERERALGNGINGRY